ncbi:MAG: 50S ribosomal protein L3 [Deltaproteobacteria bacterium]|nr:50S ribosomal protein L3 [Deltaproteobacteria bacterium]
MAELQEILAKKVGMTQLYNELGELVPVTVLAVGPCTVVQVKTADKDGYSAVQLGIDAKVMQRANQPQIGHCKKAGKGVFYHLREVPVVDSSSYAPGDVFTADMFAPGNLVTVSAKSKGKGFAGVMKRHGFKGQPASHGAHKNHRAGGSVGTSAYPGRVVKGKKMPGHMGDQKVSVKNLTVVQVQPDQGLVIVKGGVPGSKNALVTIKKIR